MAILTLMLVPALVERIPFPASVTYLVATTLGLFWLLALSLWILKSEQGNLRWSTIRRRTWLNAPLHPITGAPRFRLFFWLLPCLAVATLSLLVGVLFSSFANILARFFPHPILVGLSQMAPPFYTSVVDLASPEYAGQWWLMGLVLLNWLLSAFFAEEFFFRGILLPRMSAAYERKDWLVNAALYGLFYLYKPWMIPFRFLDGIAVAWPTRRFRSAWMAVVVRGGERLALIGIALLGVLTPLLPKLESLEDLPYLSRRPAAANMFAGPLQALPTYDPGKQVIWQVDLRGRDLSKLDLSASADDLWHADFDDQTIWPSVERMPAEYSPQQVLEANKNPGLGMRALHQKGITGRGVSIAIVDMPLLTDHQEIRSQLRWYEEINVGSSEPAQMHGAAVASIAVGRTVGVAPEANLYYIGIGDNLKTPIFYYHLWAQGIRRILEINEHLADKEKIRVISISLGWMPGGAGYQDVTKAVKEAEAQGVFVVYTSMEDVSGYKFHGLERLPGSDPDDFNSFGPASWWDPGLFQNGGFDDRLLVLMNSRTTASPTGVDDFVFYREGGLSWTVPYIAGTYALAAQVDPAITPERFWEAALKTGHMFEYQIEGQMFRFGKILDPGALMDYLRAAP